MTEYKGHLFLRPDWEIKNKDASKKKKKIETKIIDFLRQN